MTRPDIKRTESPATFLKKPQNFLSQLQTLSIKHGLMNTICHTVQMNTIKYWQGLTLRTCPVEDASVRFWTVSLQITVHESFHFMTLLTAPFYTFSCADNQFVLCDRT